MFRRYFDFSIRSMFVFTAVAAVVAAVIVYQRRLEVTQSVSTKRGFTNPLKHPFFIYKYIERGPEDAGVLFIREIEFPGFPFTPRVLDYEYMPQMKGIEVWFKNQELRFPYRGKLAYLYRDGVWISSPITAEQIRAFMYYDGKYKGPERMNSFINEVFPTNARRNNEDG